MRIRRLLYTTVLIAVTVWPALAVAQRGAASLTDRDRSDIQGLVAGYARALAGCAAEEYADLFAPGS